MAHPKKLVKLTNSIEHTTMVTTYTIEVRSWSKVQKKY